LRGALIAEASIGYTPAGKRIYRRGSAKTKTEAKAKLKEVIRDHDDGLTIAPPNYTVADAVNDWLTYGLAGRSRTPSTSTGSSVASTSSRRWAPVSCVISVRPTSTGGWP
jgi:hypothetical protein